STLEVNPDAGTTRDPDDYIDKRSAEERSGCHGREFLQLSRRKRAHKAGGPRVGFQRKIREPKINRPGLALSGFYTYFAEKRVQVLGAAEHSYLKSLPARVRVERFRNLCEHKIPCVVMSRGFHHAPELLSVTGEAKIAVFRTPMITMKFINAATIALE